MEVYQNLNGDSGVQAFEIGTESITVEFRSGRERFYHYTYGSAGANNVETMKTLARQGSGLNSFISTTVKTGYDSKW